MGSPVIIGTSGLNPSNSKTGVFPNLAGRPPRKSDPEIEQELTHAGIELVRRNALVDHPEVFTHLTGLLETRWGAFRFHRNWYYWSASGRVPLALADQMYADPVGKKDVRCGGHCGCPPPSQMARRYMLDGKTVVPLAEKAEFDHMVDHFRARGRPDDADRILNNLFFSDDPNAGEAFVENYHIDSQAGLNLFVRTIRDGRF